MLSRREVRTTKPAAPPGSRPVLPVFPGCHLSDYLYSATVQKEGALAAGFRPPRAGLSRLSERRLTIWRDPDEAPGGA